MPHASPLPDARRKLIAAAVIVVVAGASLVIRPARQPVDNEHRTAPLIAAARLPLDPLASPAVLERAALDPRPAPPRRVRPRPAINIALPASAEAPSLVRGQPADAAAAHLPAAPMAVVSTAPASALIAERIEPRPRTGAVSHAVSLAGRRVGGAFRRAGGALRVAF